MSNTPNTYNGVRTEKANKPSIEAQKIRALRKAKGTTQVELAEVILSSSASVSRVELGDYTYNKEEIAAIKSHFGITDMPLTEHECEAFRNGLYFWRDHIRDKRMVEAREMRDRFSPVLILEPCDDDLPLLYRLFDILLMFYEGGLDKAEQELDKLESKVDTMLPEHLYYFNTNKGSLLALRKRFENALEFYLKALHIFENNKLPFQTNINVLYYHIAHCYTSMESPSHAIIFLGKIPELSNSGKIATYEIGIDILRAINFRMVGHFQEAESLLKNCLLQAKGVQSKSYVGFTLFNLGMLYRCLGKWDEAISHLDQALDTFEMASEYHLPVVYHRICCLIEKRDFVKAEAEIELSEALCSQNQDHVILIKSLPHILNISRRISTYDGESVDFIENITIPFLIKECESFEAVKCYELLLHHFKRTKKKIKILSTKAAIGDIYKKAFIHQERRREI
ncbi:MAG: helix-turn-helix transcriptional regulator [Defluviitaleaceae bacterium]|nr:helix-turn-helix transcriptional regulator [Defluviitaleaceae bacterium]